MVVHGDGAVLGGEGESCGVAYAAYGSIVSGGRHWVGSGVVWCDVMCYGVAAKRSWRIGARAIAKYCAGLE